jgi:hypothetical protein
MVTITVLFKHFNKCPDLVLRQTGTQRFHKEISYCPPNLRESDLGNAYNGVEERLPFDARMLGSYEKLRVDRVLAEVLGEALAFALGLLLALLLSVPVPLSDFTAGAGSYE